MTDEEAVAAGHLVKADDCPKHESEWPIEVNGRERFGHWHKLLFGKWCCGYSTSGMCWGGEHDLCGNTPPRQCDCPCHRPMPLLQWVREVLDL